jgi:2-polyprenyl-3-methyl-5-hydroxy-6-metoxy-1,4-benzoquinol methylase
MAHQLIVKLIKPGTAVLDIGSGGGALACHLSQNMDCTVSAVDLHPDFSKYAAPYAKQCILGNIEDQSTWDRIEGSFDHIVFADVLEHLANPCDALERCKGRLTEGGSVIASVPNIAYYRIRQHLLFGRFDYGPSGILDMTHLRFFTARTVAALFADCGYDVTDFQRVFTNPRNKLLGRAFPNAFAYEFVLQAREV